MQRRARAIRTRPIPDPEGAFARIKGLLKRIPPLVRIVRAGKWIASPDRRAVWRLRSARTGRIFQPWPTTSEDRYPTLFDDVAARLAGIERPCILSFGCATGEEVRAIRRRIPGAEIVGIDPNPRAIARAIAADSHPLSEYRLADAPEDGERFDAIFAMAIFRHGDLNGLRPESCREIMPFSQFEAGLVRLDRALKPGGLLALGNAHFRLIDSALANRYSVELRLPDDPPVQTLLYGPDDRRLNGVTEDAVLFRKT